MKIYHLILAFPVIIGILITHAEATDWRFSGSLFINTTSDGASIPADTLVKNFPLLVRLHEDWFDFSQAQDDGADVRFSR